MRYAYAGYYQIRRYGLIDKYPELVEDQDTFNDIITISDDSSGGAERDRVMDIAMDISEIFEDKTSNTFMPMVETHRFDAADNDQILEVSNVLRLDGPAMSITSVTLGDGTEPVFDTDVFGKPRHVTPITQLQLLNLVQYWTRHTGQWRQAIQIEAIWGHKARFATEGFISSGDTVQNTTSISATETVMDVTSAKGLNAWNFAPRFDVGQLIRVTSDDTDEYMIVTAVDYAGNQLTLIRGVRGTTGAIHLNDAEIDVFQPQTAIMKACAEAVAFEYANLLKFETVQVSAIGGAVQATITPELWPASVIQTLRTYRNRSIGSVGSGGIYSYG